ncbi:hypothetical protein K8R33_00755 [archaeon]|nr:hypothetical protein [archaeon]
MKKDLNKIFISGIIIFIGLVIFKFIPMIVFGNEILFDASAHIAISMFILYVIWLFIDHNKKWRIPYLIFSFFVLTVISVQRIINFKHNDLGILFGFFLGVIAILVSRGNELKHVFK